LRLEEIKLFIKKISAEIRPVYVGRLLDKIDNF